MIRVEFVCSPAARQVVNLPLQLPPGSTLQQALQQAAADPRASFLAAGDWDAGLWGRRQPGSTVLHVTPRKRAACATVRTLRPRGV